MRKIAGLALAFLLVVSSIVSAGDNYCPGGGYSYGFGQCTEQAWDAHVTCNNGCVVQRNSCLSECDPEEGPCSCSYDFMQCNNSCGNTYQQQWCACEALYCGTYMMC